MKNKQNKNKKSYLIKSTAFIVLISLFLSFCPTRQADAACWPAIDPIIKQGLETVADRIKGIILGMLKQQAAKVLNNQVNKLIGGGKGSQAKFITNWQDYLYGQPKQNTTTYMNDYLSKITSGRGTMTGYQSTGGLGLTSGLLGAIGGSSTIASLLGVGSGGGAGGYASQLVSMAKQNTISQPTPQLTYSGDPSQMFTSGNFKNLSLYLSGINNPWAFDINAQREYQKKLTQEQTIARTKSVAYQGFIGTGENKGKGKITTPGIVTKENLVNVQDLGNKIIAGAQHPEEIITALISQIINKAISQGIGMASNMINQQVSKALGVQTQTNALINTAGPGVVYKTNGVNINISNLLK